MAADLMASTTRLQYTNPSFPQQEWHAFLKHYNAQFATARQGAIWCAIRGKGFVIWISEFFPSRNGDDVTWHSRMEVAPHTSEVAVQLLKELVTEALSQFKKMKVVAHPAQH